MIRVQSSIDNIHSSTRVLDFVMMQIPKYNVGERKHELSDTFSFPHSLSRLFYVCFFSKRISRPTRNPKAGECLEERGTAPRTYSHVGASLFRRATSQHTHWLQGRPPRRCEHRSLSRRGTGMPSHTKRNKCVCQALTRKARLNRRRYRRDNAAGPMPSVLE
jgi:hypothetical protein